MYIYIYIYIHIHTHVPSEAPPVRKIRMVVPPVSAVLRFPFCLFAVSLFGHHARFVMSPSFRLAFFCHNTVLRVVISPFQGHANQSCTSNGIYDDTAHALSVRNSYASGLCPVVLCPYLCTSDIYALIGR